MYERVAAALVEQLYKLGVLDWFTYTTAKEKLIKDLAATLEKEMKG